MQEVKKKKKSSSDRKPSQVDSHWDWFFSHLNMCAVQVRALSIQMALDTGYQSPEECCLFFVTIKNIVCPSAKWRCVCVLHKWHECLTLQHMHTEYWQHLPLSLPLSNSTSKALVSTRDSLRLKTWRRSSQVRKFRNFFAVQRPDKTEDKQRS